MEIKQMVLIGVVLAILAGFGYCGYRISSLKGEVSDLTIANVQLRADVKTAVDANATNQTVINNLRNDNVQASKLIAESLQKAADGKKKLDNLSAKIRVSKDTTVAAPILQETVASIVEGRKK